MTKNKTYLQLLKYAFNILLSRCYMTSFGYLLLVLHTDCWLSNNTHCNHCTNMLYALYHFAVKHETTYFFW